MFLQRILLCVCRSSDAATSFVPVRQVRHFGGVHVSIPVHVGAVPDAVQAQPAGLLFYDWTYWFHHSSSHTRIGMYLKLRILL